MKDIEDLVEMSKLVRPEDIKLLFEAAFLRGKKEGRGLVKQRMREFIDLEE